MSRYFYLDVSLEFERNKRPNITPVLYKNHIMQLMKKFFGEKGADTTVDVLKYEEKTLHAILRVPTESYLTLRWALTLCSTYGGEQCIFKVNKASPILIALDSDSRTYKH